MEPCPDSMENSSLPISDWTLEGEEIIQGDNCLLVYDDSTDSDKENPPETATYSITNSDDTKSPNYLPYDEDASEMELIMDKVLRFTPFFLPALAYCLYDPTASIFASAIDFLSSNNWVAVDGGAYQAQIIAPAINGVVVSSISLLFAILIGQTISKLYQRQNDIHRCITMEASRLVQLRNLLADFPSTATTTYKCKAYLQQYTSRLVSECHETANLDWADISGMDSELNGVFQELNQAAASSGKENGEEAYCTLLLDQTMSAVESLSQERCKRISALQSTFPPLHYTILATLALNICLAFLMETDQDIMVFLFAIQLRLLWTMLVATFCALGLVCYDLGHPFRGIYQISAGVKELYDVRLQYIASLENENENS